MASLVVMFTATGRIDNIMELKKRGTDGFVLKERPEMYVGKASTRDAINGMITTFSKYAERSKFILPLYRNFDDIQRIVAVCKAPNSEFSDYVNCTLNSKGSEISALLLKEWTFNLSSFLLHFLKVYLK